MQRLRKAIVIGIAMTMLATACGNSGSDKNGGGSTNTTGSGAASDVGVSATEIKVAQVVSITGPNASGEAGFEKGFEAYVEALNDRGGVNGRKIKITSTRDDVSDPARDASEFQQAVEQEKPFLMLNSSGTFGASDYAIQNNIPVIGTAYSIEWNKSDTFVAANGGNWKAPDPTNPPKLPAGASAASLAYIAGKLGQTKVGVFGYNIASSAQSAQNSCNDAKAVGLDCTYTDTSLDFGFTDLGASIAKIKSSGAKMFYASMDLGGCVTILRGFKRAGLDDYYLQCAVGYGPDATEKYSDVLDHALFVVGTAPFESAIPAMQTFVKELTTRKPGVKPSTTTLNGWLAGTLLEDALKAMGSNLTRQNFVDTVRKNPAFAAWDGHGLLTAIDYTHNRWDAITAGTYKPAACGGYLLRVDTTKKTWVQVGEKPKLCVGGLTSADAVKAKIAADKSSLDVPS